MLATWILFLSIEIYSYFLWYITCIIKRQCFQVSREGILGWVNVHICTVDELNDKIEHYQIIIQDAWRSISFARRILAKK